MTITRLPLDPNDAASMMADSMHEPGWLSNALSQAEWIARDQGLSTSKRARVATIIRAGAKQLKEARGK